MRSEKQKKQLKVSYPKLSNRSITVRLRKLCNCLLAKQVNSVFFRTIDEKEVTAAIAKTKESTAQIAII